MSQGERPTIDVLIVDDDFMVARIHRNFVEQTPGFRVVGTASSGQEALRLVADLQPQLVLLDIYLPDVNGLDLLHPLRAAAPEADVLVISAAREADTVRRALHGGIVHYLIKPFTYEDLAGRLEHYARTLDSLAALEDQADQGVVDRVFGHEPASPALPKGLSVETLRLVRDRLRETAADAPGADISAAEMASALGMSRGSARRYLEYLVKSGRAEVRLRYGEVGRPERRYGRPRG